MWIAVWVSRPSLRHAFKTSVPWSRASSNAPAHPCSEPSGVKAVMRLWWGNVLDFIRPQFAWLTGSATQVPSTKLQQGCRALTPAVTRPARAHGVQRSAANAVNSHIGLQASKTANTKHGVQFSWEEIAFLPSVGGGTRTSAYQPLPGLAPPWLSRPQHAVQRAGSGSAPRRAPCSPGCLWQHTSSSKNCPQGHVQLETFCVSTSASPGPCRRVVKRNCALQPR